MEADQPLQSLLISFFPPLHQIEGIITRSPEGPHKISMLKRKGRTCYFTLHTEKNCIVITRGGWCWYSHGCCVSGTRLPSAQWWAFSLVMCRSHSEDAVHLLHRLIVEAKLLLLGAWRLTVWAVWVRGVEDLNALWKELVCLNCFTCHCLVQGPSKC